MLIIVSVIVIAIITIILNMSWLILMIGGYFSSNPNTPEITYSEFPICLEYEINGQYTKVEDILICEFDGFGFNEGNGKFRKWKARLKSGNNRITLLKNGNIEIYYFPVKDDSRLAGVFMGDTEYHLGGVGDTFPDAWYTTNFEDKTINDYIINADDMIDKYNLKLLKWECSKPIQNKFKESNNNQ